MKKFFVSLIMLLILSAASVFAQSSLIATLSHDGEVSLFYGSSALVQAHDAAVSGDVITLSAGNFQSVKITKGITLRGAGFGSNRTIIPKELNIDSNETLIIEGIYLNDLTAYNIKKATFLKCTIGSIRFWKSDNVADIKFIHCNVLGGYLGASVGSSVSLINSYLKNLDTSEVHSDAHYLNCVIHIEAITEKNYRRYYPIESKIGSATFTNSIIVGDGPVYEKFYVLRPTVNASNCIAVNFGYNIWTDIISPNVFPTTEISNVFKTFDGIHIEGETFELTDEAKAKYLGSDGTEIGIYGGLLPFDPTPTNPQITKFNVANKSTIDGKLSVNIEVKSTE